MPLREALRKAAGLFIETGPDPYDVQPSVETELGDDGAPPSKAQPKTVEQVVRDAPGPNLDEIAVKPEDVQPVTAPGGQPDFTDIYKRANLPVAPFSAEQAIDLFKSLPSDLPLDVKRKTVSVTLSATGKAMGVTPETIVADASRKLAALASYAEALSQKTAEYVATSELQITQMQAQIAEKRNSIEETKQLLDSALQKVHGESDRLDDVLEFFSLDVPPSRQARLRSLSRPSSTRTQATRRDG